MSDSNPAVDPPEPEDPQHEPAPQTDPHGQPTRGRAGSAPALQPRDAGEMPT